MKTLSILTLLCLFSSSLFSDSTDLKVGDIAPEFTSKDENGDDWHSESIIGKKYLAVYFYPAAMTGGCTKQACSFRDSKQALKDLGVEVVGVSGDNSQGLMHFKKAHQLNFTLLSDTNGDIANLFGVPNKVGEKTLKRKIAGEDLLLTRGSTISRWTFLIDLNGKIAFINNKVNPIKDSQDIMDKVKELTLSQ